MALEIPLDQNGSQKFNIVINGKTYEFLVSYNSRMKYWTANISSENVSLVKGISLVGGVDILNQFTLELKRLFMVNIDNPNLDATSDNIGIDVKLYELSEEEVSSNG